MRPRAELAIGAAVLVVLGMGAAALGSRRARVGDSDPRRSSFLFGPSGASAYAEALSRMGVRVDRYRRSVALMDTSDTSVPTVLAFLGPSAELGSAEGAGIASLKTDLLLAGPAAGAAMRCLGYDVVRWRGDSVAVHRPAPADSLPVPSVRWLLRRRSSLTVVDSSALSDGRAISCTAKEPSHIDTLLIAAGRAAAVRLAMPGGRVVTLVSDDRLFSNRAVRESSAGPFVLGLVVPRYRRVLIDEYHHGFDASGSLAGATLDWAAHSPWGWIIWQLVAVGVIALLAAGVRFGPAQSAIERRRRSPLEHVRALATALAAARGHDVAVRLIVQGLRRRLSRAGRPGREKSAEWLASLSGSVRTPEGHEALERLAGLARAPVAAEDVLVAANDVETLWEELKPS